MRFFALYQRSFSGLPKPLQVDSHAFVGSRPADSLECAFERFQVENLSEQLRGQIAGNYQVRHSSMSVGDLFIDEAGFGQLVQLVGFEPLALDTPVQRSEYALHLMSLRLEHTAGWQALFEKDAAELARLIAQRLRSKQDLVVYHALNPYLKPSALETAP